MSDNYEYIPNIKTNNLKSKLYTTYFICTKNITTRRNI